MLAAAACSRGFGVDHSDTAFVHGRVTAQQGAPVSGAEVDVTAFSGNCESNLFSTVSAETDSAGRYSVSIIGFRSGLRSCIQVRAVPPAGSGLQPAMSRVPNVSPSRSRLDSLRVDLELIPAGE